MLRFRATGYDHEEDVHVLETDSFEAAQKHVKPFSHQSIARRTPICAEALLAALRLREQR